MSLSPAEVAALRTSMGLSQDGMGRMLGVNVRTVRGWESGLTTPSPQSVTALWALARQHRALVAQLASSDVPVGILREPSQPGSPPRGWFLAAAGQAMLHGDGIDVEWVE